MIPRPERFRMILAAIGIIFALAALALNDRRFTWIAIGVLAAALVLRLLTGRKRLDTTEDNDDD